MSKSIIYDHTKVEKKWQEVWFKEKIYKPKRNNENYYLLVELAYTSGNLHMGHWFAWTAPDIYARLKRMQGKNVLFPVGGFDAFGLPAENAAIKHGIHPKDWTYANIENMRKQFRTMGPSFDWDSEVITCEPEYYKWTQWLFIKLFEKGLAYKKEVWSNWCPECKTVLANEHVVEGCCWRHTSTKVFQKKVKQWLFRITDYADRLIWSENPKVDWPKAARDAQNNWIGRSEGVNIKFKVKNTDSQIDVFTTRPETIFGATFLVLAPEHPLVLKVTTSQNKQKVSKYIKESLSKLERKRLEEIEEKTGVFTGSYAINPLTKRDLPIWVADFVLGSYGKGAIMGVPAHDKRDWGFAEKYGLPIKKVIKAGDSEEFYEGEGKMFNSGKYSGIDSIRARKLITNYILKNHLGEKSVQYHLRDWTISRQRYWGVPIPMIFCLRCKKMRRSWFTKNKTKNLRLDWEHYGWYPVDYKDLPVILPNDVDYTPTGKPPLATAREWMRAYCPGCGSLAEKEVETMDTYVDSSWYFFRYPNPRYEKGPFDPKVINSWMPIKIYFGGPEHILGHTLYARFITKFLYDLGLIKFDEFALKRFHHGVILGPDGYRMSKSRGNVVNPDEQVRKFGADAVRVYIAFLGPHDKGGTWKTEGIEGSYRFLRKIWRFFNTFRDIYVSENEAREILVTMHKTIKKVTEDIEKLQTNTALAAIMEFYNLLYRKARAKTKEAKNSNFQRVKKVRCAEWEEAIRTLCLLLAPFAPHMTEEIYQRFFAVNKYSDSQKTKKFNSVHLKTWPKFIPELILEDKVVLAIQVNGKLRTTLKVGADEVDKRERIIMLARKNPRVRKWLKGKEIKKEIYVAGKVVNFVTT